jgi:hypothetical protein
VGTAEEATPDPEVEVAMTRKVVRSKRITSVAPQACAKMARCFERMDALGMRVWTMLDHACVVMDCSILFPEDEKKNKLCKGSGQR